MSLGPQGPLALPGMAERTGPRLLARDDQPSLADDVKNRLNAPATPRRATALSAGLRPRVFIIHILSLDKKDIAMAGYVSNPKVLSGPAVSRSGIDVTKLSEVAVREAEREAAWFAAYADRFEDAAEWMAKNTPDNSVPAGKAKSDARLDRMEGAANDGSQAKHVQQEAKKKPRGLHRVLQWLGGKKR